MVLDIAAVQEIYGADPDTRRGDTTYAFEAMSSSLRTIYDAGGNDTLDLSGIAYANVVDLQPGAYSSIGMATVAEQIAYWTAKYPANSAFILHVFNEYMPEEKMKAYTFLDNVAIALSTVVENVLGGSGRDEISGNTAANLLVGNAGDDVLIGLEGADRLEGGSGDDALYGDGIAVVQAPPVPQPTPVAPEPKPVDPPPVVGGGGLQVAVTGAQKGQCSFIRIGSPSCRPTGPA